MIPPQYNSLCSSCAELRRHQVRSNHVYRYFAIKVYGWEEDPADINKYWSFRWESIRKQQALPYVIPTTGGGSKLVLWCCCLSMIWLQLQFGMTPIFSLTCPTKASDCSKIQSSLLIVPRGFCDAKYNKDITPIFEKVMVPIVFLVHGQQLLAVFTLLGYHFLQNITN